MNYIHDSDHDESLKSALIEKGFNVSLSRIQDPTRVPSHCSLCALAEDDAGIVEDD